MTTLTTRAMLSLAALAVIASACGGSDTEIFVTASEFQFSPNSWSVAADTDIAVSFTNDGAVEHEWAVLREGVTISSEEEFNEDIVLLEIEAQPVGTTVTETFSFAPGTYQVICALDGHFDAGMTGTLTVGG